MPQYIKSYIINNNHNYIELRKLMNIKLLTNDNWVNLN